MPTDKIDQIYNAMSADGASMPSRQSFRKKMLAPGAEGYKNRKAFYDAMVADGANLGGSYEAFAKKIGLHAVKPAPAPALQRPVQNMKQNAGKPSSPQYKRAQLSDMLGNTMDQTADALHPKPVGYALSQEHRDEVLGKQAEVSPNQGNPHVQRARMQGHVAGFKRKVREGRKYGRPGLARGVGDAINGDEKALKDTGLPQVMQQKKDELDYSMATGKQLRNPVDAGLTYDENGNVVHSMFAPTVARDGDGNMLAGDDGKPIIGISTDKARAEAYGDAVQADIESQRKREATKNLYKEAVKSVDEAFNGKYEKEEAYRKEHPFLGIVRQALEGFGGSSAVGGGNVFQYVPEEAKAGMAAVGMLTKAQRMKNDADRYGDAGILSRLYGGIMAGLTDVSTYDFGITDTFNAAALYQAAKNYENGKASAKDKMLLDAAALAGSMQAEASEKLGGAYGAGQNLIGTMGFMMQFYNNPASGSGKAIASKVAGTVARRAIEKFGKGAIAKAVTGLAKGATRVGMDAAEAAVVTGMYSPTKIVGDYLNRKTGDVQSDGKGGYIFKNKEYSDVKALAKAINDQYAENISEMWGEYLPGVGKVNAAIGRGARKIGLGKVVDAFEHMSSSNWAKTWKRFQERTKWNGMAGEYFEEVANNLYNAVTNGDMTLDTDPHTGVFNPQINRDTFYSVALMSGMMSAVQTAGYARERFRAPHLRKKADAQARSVFGDRWNDYKEAIDNADEKQIGKVMEKIGKDRSLSNSQKIAALQYQYRTAVVHGVNAQDVKNKLEGCLNVMDEAYAMGYDAQSDRELNNTAILYDEAKKQAMKSTGWDETELERMIGDDDGVKVLGHMLNDRGKFSPEQLQAVTDYANARAAYHGMIQRVQDDIDSRVQESDLEADRRTNAVTDSIHPATMKVGNRNVYVVNGIVSMLPDGSGVDHEHSDDFLVIRDAETGELETTEPSAILSVDAPIDPVQEKTDAAANIRQAYAQQEADRIDGKLAFSPGDTYSVSGEDGERHTLYIIGDAVDEKTGQPIPDMVTATVDSGQQTVLSKEQVQRQVEEARRAAVAEIQRRTPQQDSPFDYNDDIVLTDEAGRTVRGTITTGRNDDGRYEVYTEGPVNGKHVNLFSDEDLSAFHARKQGQEASPETEAVAQPVLQGTAAGEVQTADAGERQGNTEAAEETPQAEGTALERIPKDGNGQPLLEQTDPETAWDGVVEYMEDAGDAKEYVGSMVARLSKEAEAAAKAVGRIKPTGDMAQFKADKAAARQTQAAAEARLEHWKNIADVQNKREYAAQAAEQKERAEREAEIRRQAVEEEKQRQQEERQKQAEQEERGSNSVAPAIREKWDASPKVDGAPNEIVLPDGERVSGHYVLTESGAASPSHNATAEFAKTEGFPVDGNGQSVNDRDYERDRDAQAVTRSIARNYDSRALQSPVVVSRDGVVLSGNGRTMAGELAAADNTDGAYVGHLQKYPQQFGFTPAQVKGMKHPRVVFVPDADLPYTAETFAKFNQQEMKGQSKTEQAVKLGKVVDDRTFAHITRSINGYDTLGEFYADHKATHAAIKELQASGVLSHAQMAEMFDGDGISAQGREILENMLIGKAFESNPDAIREITAFKSVRQSVITALSEIVNNKSLGADYSLEDELAQAVDLVYKARKAGHRSGDRVSSFARQQNLFSFDEGDTVADYNNATMLMLADVLNDSRITQLKKILSVYNQKAADSAAGQTDMFSGGVKTKEEIWNEVKQLIDHGTEEEQQKAVREAAERRKESVLQDEPSGRGDEGSGGVRLSDEIDENGRQFVLTSDGSLVFGEIGAETGLTAAPILLSEGMITNPMTNDGYGLVHIEARHGNQIRKAGYKSVVDFVEKVGESYNVIKEGNVRDGHKTYRLQMTDGHNNTLMVELSNDGAYWNINTAGIFKTSYGKNNKEVYNRHTTAKQPVEAVGTSQDAEQSDTQTSSRMGVPTSSFGKDSKESGTKQEKPEKFVPSARKVGENILDYAARVAEEHHAHKVRKAEEAKVDTRPTEAQKESGNYKKGHIRVDGLDITIEQPKGSIRRGKDANGKEWESEMHSTYGYIRGTKGTDGDHIDVYLSDNPAAGNVYVVDQIDQQTGEFDEHKVMYGFGSMEEAVQAYRDQYEDGWKIGNVTEVSREEFKKWVDSSTRKTKPFADYKTVRPLDTERTQSDGNYAHNSEEIMHEDVKPAESSEKYTITPTQYTNKKGKTSDMYLVKFNNELSKEEKAAAKAFVGEPLAEGRRTPRGWYDRGQGGYMVRSEEAARQLGGMMADEVAVADEQPLTVQDYRNAVAPAVHKEQEKKPSNTVSVEDAAIQDVEAVVHSPEHKDSGLDFNGDVSKEDFNDALKDLRSLLGVSDDEGDVGILFRDDDELTKEQRKKIKAAGLSVTQVLVDNGMVRFPDYAGRMVSLIGDKIRPWLKSFYEGIRWEPGYESVDFTPSDEVARFDVQNFDKPSPDILKQAEMVVAEQKAAKISKQTEREVKSERNEKRKENEKQTEANTAAIAEEAGTVASEARAVAERAAADAEVRNATEKVDATLEKVNNQLALLGYYEADKVDNDFNEAYGYLRNAEKKAVKDATELAKRLADDFGIDLYEATHTAPDKNGKRKSKPLATANIAPIGGDITIHLPIQDEKDLWIYINLKTTGAKGSFVQGDNLEVGNIMYRIENPNTTGGERYGSNNFATSDITYDRLRNDISRIIDSTVRETPTKQPTNSKVLAQYNALKSKHPDAKLLFRVGDFYETYQDDAEDVSNTLGIVLTKRNDGVNMAGFPYHALDIYLPKLIRAGYRVAICDQLEMPKETEKVVPKDTPQPKKVNVESLVRELQEKGKARLRDHAEEVKEKPATPDLHGFNIGDKVMYKGKEATLYDTDNGRPVLDAGLAPVMYEVTDWDKLTPVSSTTDTTPAKEKTSTEKEKPIKKNNSKKKSVSLKREPTVGDLFGDLFSNNDLDNKDNDTARTQQAERSSREDRSVGSISADRDGVLDTRSTGGTDGGETARVSNTTGTVADGERKEVPGQRSDRTTSGGNHGDGEITGRLSDGGRGVGNGAPATGRNGHRGSAAASAGVQEKTGSGGEGVRHGMQADGRSSSDPRGDRLYTPAAERPSSSETAGNRREVQGRGRRELESKFKRNYLYPENSSEIDNMTPQQRLRSNVEALEVVRTLMKEGREATADEREILGRYRGWGGVDLGRAYSTDMMRRSFTDRWGTPTEQGKLISRLADIIDELDPNGERGVLSAINRAALTSYYTPTAVARVMNGFVEQAGFKGGNMLDPSMGSGIFEGTMSKAVQQRTMIHGIELDWLTGQIARNLYPDANVLVTGYEQAGTADNAYDVVMSNIPFGDLSVTDKTWKHDSSPVRKAAQNRIHNYFAVKMLDNTRPGGLCIIMTSNAILDTKSNQIIREHLADKAEVLGAVRLPDNTFKGAGTSVVTDVIFLRKFKDEADRTVTRGNEAYTTNIEKPFLSSGELKLKNPTDGKTYKVAVNGYFAKNRDMMIGDGKAGGQYRADEFGLSSAMGTDDIAKAMGKLVEKKIVGDRKGKLFDTHKTEREVKQAVSEAYKGDGNYISSGNIVEQDGMIGVVTSTKNKYGDVTTTFNEMPSLKSKADRILAMFPVRKAMKQLIDMQIQGENEHNLSEARAELQKAYDEFVKKYGRLNDKGNDFLTEDIDGYTLRSLEKYDDSKFAGLSDIFTKNTIKPALDMTTARTLQDAISLSLAEYGEIKPSFMKDVLGESWAEQCGEMLFRTPFTEDEYETADAYLSGDVKTKLEQARAAVREDASLQRNVEALEAIQPKDIPFEDISIRMGARWIPAEVYTDFMYEQFGIQKYEYRGNKSGVEYMPEVDQYVVNVAKNELGGEADAWRTSRRSASEVFTAALQDKSLSVFDTIKEDGKETKVLNKEETELLNNKIQDLRTAFEDWIGQNPEREEMLMRLYNDKFNRTVLRKFDGSHLNVAGLMGKELRPHQKDAVWMLINNRGGIVDHIVGAGKTLVMQSSIMEMRRMGIAKKPMIIALKSTVAQIAKEFRETYPAARILAPTEKDFASNNRKKFMAQIALNDYDCVILSHDQYNMLPHTEEVERSVIDEQMAQLDNAIEFLYGQDDKSQLTKKQIKGLEKRKNNLETNLTNLLDRKIDREFTFEGLGVDYLFVDECQHFKSLPYVSTYDRVAGLGDKKGSQKAIALLNGVRYLQKMHQGDQGTVFLSGTTISNSLSEIYHLLNYLRPSEMERLGMTTFDAWAGNFAIHTAELEYGVTSELKEKDRFRSLTNIPELAKMYAEIADVRNDLNLKLPKPKMRSHIVTVPQTDLMQEINREIVNMVKSKDGSYFNIASNENTPWGLLASTLSAKAAINPRLIDESWESEGGKIPAVCENVKKIYDQFAEQKGTQLIFCDTGVPGKGKKYDAYTDIINRLVNDYGIPRKEIADIHVANTDEKRKKLFAKVNDGSVRILIGGTKNMGTGVNVQKRIVAMHHVDVPWTPADREQREGRGVRQGNEIARDFNDDNVDVYFYATEGSLDMYKYQLQETKGKLFAQFKSGTIGDRTFDEGGAEENFDPAEVVAMLSGNPVIFEKSKQDKKVEKLRRAKRAYESDWQRRHARYEELQTKKSNFERLLSFNAGDVRELERGGFTPDADGKYPTTVTVSVKDDYSSRKTFEKPKEAGAYIHELLKQGKKVQLSGFHQTANISISVTEAGIFGKPVAELESYGGIKYTVEVSDDDTAAGVAFRNLLQKVYSNRKVYERNIEDVNNQLKGADPGENAFPKQAELDEALKEKKRLDEEYKKLSDEQDKPSANDDTRYRDFDEEVNEQFNRELTELTEKNAQSKRLKLGQPSPMLSAAGVPDKPIILYGNKLLKKAKLHNFDVKELHNLPLAMQNPIAVFEGSHPNSFATLLEIKLGGYNTLASIEVNKKGEADFNIISSLFGKESKGITKWILDGKLLSVDKEKAQSYISASALNADATYKNELSSAAKIVKDFVNPSIGGEKLRDGTGSYTDNELSLVNDPAAKMLGKTNRTDAERKAFAERERRRMAGRVKELADRLHLDNVDVVADSGTLQGRKAKAKGFYSKSSGKITIVIPNHSSVDDAEKTLLHEAVAHYGLRKLFGSHFDTFLDNVFRNVEPQVRRSIVSLSSRNGWDFRTATEEYLAGLAEKTEFENVPNTVWNKIKSLFLKMLHGIGFKDWSGVELGDNELRYLLWRSYENMKEPGRYRSILGEAEDIAKQNELKVGNYAPTEEKALASAAEETGSVAEGNFLFRDDGGSGETVRAIYEHAVKDAGSRTMLGAFAHALASSDGRRRFKNQFAESYFDYSRSIKQLQDAIERGLGTRLESHEDVWRTLNAKGSADAQEVNLAMLRYIAPLAEHIGEMIHGRMLKGKKIIMDDVEAYMNSVHGIERNARMQEASFRDAVMRQLKTEGYAGEERAAIAEAELEKLRKGEGSAYTDLFAAARRDYSGLTALFGDTVEDSGDVVLLEEAARRYASEFEESVGHGSTLKFWDMVRAMNDFSLRKSYLSGLISKAQYDSVRKMYKHYVPLRGWHDDYAGDVYQYISRGEHGDLLQDALKKARGRKSRAGDIIGTMAAMANTAIVQGNRNLVAQKFLNMALNHGQQSGLLMVGKQWYEENSDGDLVPLYPKLHDGMTVEQQQSEIERFEAEMKAKEKSGEVRVMHRDFNKEMSLNMPKWEEREHCVRVLRNGVEYQVYVLGNPRAAQAFNGLLTKQSDAGVIAEGWANLMRLKATMQTSLSPEFIFSNFQRDILTAETGTYIKFGRKASLAFAKNLAAVNPMAGIGDGRIGGIFTLLRRYEQGTLNMYNDMERMFGEFVRNGGMTGVSVIEGKDEYQKSIEKAVKRIGRGNLDMPRKALHEIADAVEFLNSGIENATRFAAYMVSRQTLRKSVTESIFDAKEASVNFNMKGSGHWGNLWLRRNILYSNPAIQSLRMLGTWYEASPKRFVGAMSRILAMSVGMAMLWASVGAGVSDDDNDWYKLSEWNRYNYINIRTRHGYAHWSLPQEIRPVWALGQIVFDWQCGMITGERAINSMVTQLNNLSPMAFFSGGMDSKDSYWKTAVRAWTPTILADFTDAYLWNENFLGQKITNQEDYNVDSPEYRRSGRNTPQWAVDLSRMWNSVTGGAPNRKSYWDSPALNPSALYYILQQQSGGLGIIVTKLSKAYEQLEDPDVDVEAKNIPFVSKVWVSTEDKQSVNRVVDDKFWLIYNDWKLTDSEIRHNRSDVESGKMTLMEFAERMDELRRSGDYGRWAALNGIMKSYGKLRSAERDGKDIDDAVRRLKKDVVSIDGMNKTRK